MKKKTAFFSSAQDARAPKGRFVLPLLVLLFVVTFVTAGMPCTQDLQCRRDVCITSFCKPRATTDGTCEKNSHCFKASTEACITKKCLAKSLTDGVCDEQADCASTADDCKNEKCTFEPSLMLFDGNKAPLNAAISSSSHAVGNVLFVIEGYFDPTLMTVEAYNSLTNTWTSKTGPNIASYGHSAVLVGTTIFLIGGRTIQDALTTFYSYDTINDKWDKTWDQMPDAIQSSGVAAVGKTLFLFGGFGSDNKRKDAILSIDVSAKGNGWKTLSAVLPTPTAGFSATTIGTDIYLTGGSTDSAPAGVSTVLKFDSLNPNQNPSSNGLSPLLSTRYLHMSFYEPVSKRLYVVAGAVKNQKAVDYLDMNNPSGSWVSTNADTLSIFSDSRNGGLINSRFYFASASTLVVLDVKTPASVAWKPFSFPTQTLSIIQKTGPNTITAIDVSARQASVYDIASDSWSVLPTVLTGLSQSAPSVVVNGELYVLGAAQTRRSNLVYALNTSDGSWNSKASLSPKREAGCAAADGTDIYLFGGAPSESNSPDTTLLKLDTKANQWSTISTSGAATAVKHCAALTVNGKLLIFGGATDAAGASPTGLIQSFDIASKTWDSPFTAKITPRSKLSVVLFKDFVFIIGGTADGGVTSLAKSEVFDINAKTISSSADLPTPRYSLASVTDGSFIYSVGGMISQTIPFTTLERLRAP